MENQEYKRNNIISNLIWKFLESTGAQLVSLVVSTLIARAIDPEAYGVVAIVQTINTILNVFVDSGLSNALIQKKNADDLDFSSVFYTNVIFCILIYIILFFGAPLIANIFQINKMVSLIRVSGVVLLLSALKNVQCSYISKKMLFKKFFFSTLGGKIGAGIIGVYMAYNGYGAWALVIANLFNNIIDTIIIWIAVDWRPKIMFSFERTKKLFSYGWKLLVSSLFNTIYDKLHQIIIAMFYSTTDLAYFDKGDSVSSKITTNINNSIASVLMPVLSKEQDDDRKMVIIAKRTLQATFYIMTPLLIGLCAIAEPLVKFFLTDKWIPIIPYLRIMCIVRLFKPMHTTNLNIIQSKGRSDIFLKLDILKSTIGIFMLLVFSQFGVLSMAYSQLLITFVSHLINAYPTKKLLNYSYIDQIKDVAPILTIGSIMGLSVYFVSFINLNSLVIVILQIIIGGIVYIGLSILFKLEAFKYTFKTILGFIKKEE